MSAENKTASDTVREEVLRASNDCLDSFNRGDAASCADAYLPDGSLTVHDAASEAAGVRGREKISDSWSGLIAKNANSPVPSPGARVRDVSVMPLDESTCMLERSASLGSGDMVTKETWVKQDGKVWKKAEEQVTVVESFSDL